MVKLRLRRRGRKRLPIYDIVAADSRSPRDGRYIERIGQYNPLISSTATFIDRDRARYWVKTGAQPSDTVRNILSREGIYLALQMESKGASAEEITEMMEAHVAGIRSREASNAAVGKKAEPAPAAEEAPAAEAEEAPAAEAATEEAPAAEAEAAPAEEAPATEEEKSAE